MTAILHISDPHFGTERPSVLDALNTFITDCRPELVILSGDVTQRARRSQFESARRFITQLPAPALVIPGNHDIPLYNLPMRWLSPYANYRRALGPDLEPIYESDRILAIGLNTTRPARHKDGEVSAEQIERVAKRLATARPGQLRLVALHHPVRAKVESDLSNLLHGREAAMAAWVDAGADLLLAGHIHLPYVMPLARRDSRVAWAVQAGTALSSRVRGEVSNSVNLIRHDPADLTQPCLVERWDYDAAQSAFSMIQRHELLLDRRAAS
ncbi:metallophosphoesterase [Pigmentiphaga aceris]|uniref:Metallophosphoesterase n=1 Tax=Pigmentiphaga aceris TaxID=1940612 RepID=A0A5C0AY05_9BURK|nr:metallophosphoesterase [Pigmentiphaga aceris]QEI05710.1 metallophosphoesterase [Pigmentiphaga aceris]